MKKIALVILFATVYHLTSAQKVVKLTLIYSEPRLEVVNRNGELDSIIIHVREPCKPDTTYSKPDLGYETSIGFMVNEYCPIQVCKINKCIELFIDSEEIQVLISPNEFTESRPLNSPQSFEWQSALREMRSLLSIRLDSLSELSAQNSQLDTDQIKAFYKRTDKLFALVARRWIARNNRSALGWNLFIRYPDVFDKDEFYALFSDFSSVLKLPSVELARIRLQNLGDVSRQKGIPDQLFNLRH